MHLEDLFADLCAYFESFNDIDHPQIEADRLAAEFGDNMLDKLRNIGVTFEAGVADGREAAE